MSIPNIVVVDDQPSTCKEIAGYLKFDYTVHAFKSGEEALFYLSENKADLILLDYYMPDKTGYEVLLALRTSALTRDTPVIFFTSETNERMRKELMGRGATDFLCKPINTDELKECVKKHLP